MASVWSVLSRSFVGVVGPALNGIHELFWPAVLRKRVPDEVKRAMQDSGKVFVIFLTVLLLLLVALDVLAHIRWTPTMDATPATELTPVDSRSKIAPDVEGILWFLGEADGKALLEQIATRNGQIDTLTTTVAKKLAELGTAATACAYSDLVRNLSRALAAGRYDEVRDELLGMVAQMDSVTKATIGSALVDGLLSGATDLARVALTQRGVPNTLPHFGSTIFWTSRTYSMLEALLCAAFGVLINLLFNSAEHIRIGDFDPDERWVGFSKIVCAPIVCVILLQAARAGLTTFGTAEFRAVGCPVIAFMIGFGTRQAVNVLDRLVSAFFGRSDYPGDNVAPADATDVPSGRASPPPVSLAEAEAATMASINAATRSVAAASVKRP